VSVSQTGFNRNGDYKHKNLQTKAFRSERTHNTQTSVQPSLAFFADNVRNRIT